MNDELLDQLADALGVEAEAILDFNSEPGGNGYCVILDTFEKRRHVQLTKNRKRKAANRKMKTEA